MIDGWTTIGWITAIAIVGSLLARRVIAKGSEGWRYFIDLPISSLAAVACVMTVAPRFPWREVGPGMALAVVVLTGWRLVGGERQSLLVTGIVALTAFVLLSDSPFAPADGSWRMAALRWLGPLVALALWLPPTNAPEHASPPPRWRDYAVTAVVLVVIVLPLSWSWLASFLSEAGQEIYRRYRAPPIIMVSGPPIALAGALALWWPRQHADIISRWCWMFSAVASAYRPIVVLGYIGELVAPVQGIDAASLASWSLSWLTLLVLSVLDIAARWWIASRRLLMAGGEPPARTTRPLLGVGMIISAVAWISYGTWNSIIFILIVGPVIGAACLLILRSRPTSPLNRSECAVIATFLGEATARLIAIPAIYLFLEMATNPAGWDGYDEIFQAAWITVTAAAAWRLAAKAMSTTKNDGTVAQAATA